MIMIRQSLYVLLILTAGCGIYSPQVTPPVVVESAGDMQFDLGVTIDKGVQTNFALAATDQIAFQCAAMVNTKNIYMLDGSIGYSQNLGQMIRIGLFGGGSRGSGKNKYAPILSYDKYEINGSSRLLYLKPQLILFSKKVDFAVASKFGNIRQHFYYYEYITSDRDKFIREIEENRVLDAFFIEPSFSAIFKTKKARLVGSFSIIRNYGSSEQQGGISPFNLGLSIQQLRKAK